MRDDEMNLFAFWALHGYRLSELAEMSAEQLMFLSAAREIYFDEQKKA